MTPPPAGRAELGLADAARAVLREWRRYMDSGTGEPGPVETAVTRLADALAETGAAAAVDMAEVRGRALGTRLTRAAAAASACGQVTVLTTYGTPAALVIPAGTARGYPQAAP